MPFLQRSSHGSPLAQLPPLVARHEPGVDGSEDMVHVLLILSLTFASISVLATLTALYWFVKMRRSFRHEQWTTSSPMLTCHRLILLLIQSDFLKSLSFLVFAIASFAWGNIESNSIFCQLSGFALAVATESSDIAVLLIAVHSAMFILRPRSGLYLYRRLAYLVFYLLPSLVASLAFIGGNGYENMGHYCYLRTDRSWARLALSWAPRYFICTSIVVISIFIYLYIRTRMRDYGRRRSEAMQPRLPRDSSSLPPSPCLCCHGLIPSTASSRRSSATDTMPLKGSVRYCGARTSADSHPPKGTVMWNWRGFSQARSPCEGRASDDSCDPICPDSSRLLSPPTVHAPRRNAIIPDDPPVSPHDCTHRPELPDDIQRPRRASYPTTTPSRTQHHHLHRPKYMPILETDSTSILPRNISTSTSVTTTTTTTAAALPRARTSPQPQPGTKPAKSPLRQLRSLFVYPLVYIIVWLFPFVSHILGYDDDSRANTTPSSPSSPHRKDPPHWLLTVSIISLCAQGLVDCVVFMLRETPWRYAAGRGFLVAFGKRWMWSWGRRWDGDREGVGRTREEMLVDGRLARERREGEVRVEMTARGRGKGAGAREWWDVWDGEGEREGREERREERKASRRENEEDEEGQVAVQQEVG
ncbi:G protein-coupled glucose receptor regulating Gpa2-domain-containing protein [Staphylotrichum tortipilum]|uniref:G protein-coupled glucose receptor regulating Gpa2-domain-containing protein n=1 Tax=Staphylotrichum tortipilum TaxID=2831512 RepID=A0AAN6RRW5_9PEZI|nr:G protein-coupled glucose receptor regulating Gpa2-domain-containing protein [Staphylotrichum longicolle]